MVKSIKIAGITLVAVIVGAPIAAFIGTAIFDSLTGR
jgi:hypothetical protein